MRQLKHNCFKDLECWHDWWHYGMPIRRYYDDDTFKTNRLFSGNMISRWRWRNAVPIEINVELSEES